MRLPNPPGSVMGFGAFDILFTTLLVLGVATGTKAGFGEMVWAFVRWPAMALLGSLASVELGSQVAEVSGTSTRQGAILAYVGVALAIAITTALLQKRFGNRVLAAIPPGRVDRFFGGVAGLVARASLILFVLALLHPIDGRNVDWNPADSNSEGAVNELFLAVFGTLRRAAIDQSWYGQMLEQNWGDLLLS